MQIQNGERVRKGTGVQWTEVSVHGLHGLRLTFREVLSLGPYRPWISRPFFAAPRQSRLIHVVHHVVEQLLCLAFISSRRNQWGKSINHIADPREAELAGVQTGFLRRH